MQAKGEAHLGEHVLVVADRRRVHTEPNGHAGGPHALQRCYARAQTQVRAWVVANRGAALDNRFDIGIGGPNAVRE